jgi:hypothetical protein
MLPRMERDWQLLVGGHRRDARTGRTATISEPGTGKPQNVYFSSEPRP